MEVNPSRHVSFLINFLNTGLEQKYNFPTWSIEIYFMHYYLLNLTLSKNSIFFPPGYQIIFTESHGGKGKEVHN